MGNVVLVEHSVLVLGRMSEWRIYHRLVGENVKAGLQAEIDAALQTVMQSVNAAAAG